jgi:putative ABC transport system permease protein
MKTPLVLLNLLHQPMRTAVAVLGVAFAILLVFMQLGFYGSAEKAATTLYNALDFDLVLISSNYLNSTRPSSFPRRRIYQTLEHPDVASASPLYIDWMTWRITDKKQRRAILTLACNLEAPVLRRDSHVFPKESADECLRRLRTPDTVLMDVSTRSYFGKHGPGTITEMNRTTIRVVGELLIGTGYGADGMVLTSDDTYARLTAARALDQAALGLIKLKPGARKSADEVKADLIRDAFHASPRDEVQVFTRDEIEERERNYWMYRTSVGIIFFVGVIVALVVGVIFVYQVIATDISDHVAEYATLRAVGYAPSYLSRIVLRQALALALLGYIPGFVVAFALYALGREAANLLLFMTWGRAVFVLVLSFAMCSLSGLLALRKVKTADPAEMF